MLVHFFEGWACGVEAIGVILNDGECGELLIEEVCKVCKVGKVGKVGEVGVLLNVRKLTCIAESRSRFVGVMHHDDELLHVLRK